MSRVARRGCHAAPLHESLPVAWRRLRRTLHEILRDSRTVSPRRPGARLAITAGPEGPAKPPAGRGAAAALHPATAAAPLIDTVLLAPRRPGATLGRMPRHADEPDPRLLERVRAGLLALPEVTR